MDKNGAWFSGAEKTCSQLERTKIFWTVDQNGVTRLQSFRQNLTRIAVKKIDILFALQFRFRGGRVFRFSIVFDAGDARFGKTAGENQRALAASPTGLDGDTADAAFVSADVWPDVSVPEVADAILEHFKGGGAC